MPVFNQLWIDFRRLDREWLDAGFNSDYADYGDWVGIRFGNTQSYFPDDSRHLYCDYRTAYSPQVANELRKGWKNSEVHVYDLKDYLEVRGHLCSPHFREFAEEMLAKCSETDPITGKAYWEAHVVTWTQDNDP